MFWNKKQEKEIVVENTDVKELRQETVEFVKSVQETIEEIHESFYTEVDKLLEEAKLVVSVKEDKQKAIDKAQKLKSLGFTGTKEFKETEKLINKLTHSENLIEAINYFSFKYPHYKFITEESVKKICEKYNLVYGTVDKYTGTVPDYNLEEMLNFKVDDKDCAYTVVERSNISNRKRTRSFDECEQFLDQNTWSFSNLAYKSPLEIAAPASDFTMSNSELKNFKISDIEIPDPVVLQPVMFKNERHFLICTAWGLEAQDELVMNPKHN